MLTGSDSRLPVSKKDTIGEARCDHVCRVAVCFRTLIARCLAKRGSILEQLRGMRLMAAVARSTQAVSNPEPIVG